jgi:hypothetical protein
MVPKRASFKLSAVLMSGIRLAHDEKHNPMLKYTSETANLTRLLSGTCRAIFCF